MPKETPFSEFPDLMSLLGIQEEDISLLFQEPPTPQRSAPAEAVAHADALSDSLSEELVDVTNRVATQYVQVVALVAAQVFSGKASTGTLDQLETAAASLQRLASVIQSTEQIRLLDDLLQWCAQFRDALKSGRGRQRVVDQLRAWVPQFADTLGNEGSQLRDLTQYDLEDVPLFGELEGLKGIGPRRLQRLYTAGLFTVESLRDADPGDISLVTGLPRPLAEQVVARTRAYAEERRQKVIRGLQSRLQEFSRLIKEVNPSQDPTLAAAAAAAIEQMRQTIASFPLSEPS